MLSPERLDTALGGRYRIAEELGRGGMATVYRARDLRHDRDVALKVLDPELGAMLGAERFLSEIRTTARLDHPHILTLIDSGEADGLLYYVLPYVPGESLRDRLNRERQLPVDDAIALTRQVASALDYAHHRGVLHRDIKPENILLLEGEAMLADFGIALGMSGQGQARLTATGVSLGTPQYMSPEQATAERDLDARTDVYSLAAVLYEMLGGEPPITGRTTQAIVAKLLVESPTPLRVVRPAIPAHVDAAVAKALSKIPADRFSTAGGFATALLVADARTPRRAPAVLRDRGWRIAGAATLVAIVSGLAYQGFRPRTALPPFSIVRTQAFTTDPGLEIQPAISPDGLMIAYAAGNSARMRVLLRPIAGGRIIPLSDDSDAVEIGPRWSPDGARLLFLTRGGVSVAPALGGSAVRIAPPARSAIVASAVWSPDGREIAFARGDSLLAVSVDGGAPRVIGVGREPHSCDWNPANARWIACVEFNSASTVPGPLFANQAQSAITLFDARAGRPPSDTNAVRIVDASTANESPRWSADGRRLLFVSNRGGSRDVYALRVSSAGAAEGEPLRLTTGLNATAIAFSADGRRLVYSVAASRANVWSLPIPPERGASVSADRMTRVTAGSQVIEGLRPSPDGKWLVYDSDLRGNSDIFRLNLGGGEPEQLTSEPADEFAGDLSPDGQWLAYHSWRKSTRNIEVKPMDGGPVQFLTDDARQSQWPRWSPDGRSLSFSQLVPPFRAFIMTRHPDGTWSAPRQFTDHVNLPEWSPDGRWLAAIRRDAPGAPGAVVVIPADGADQRKLYEPSDSVPPAGQVAWSEDGRLLYFKTHDAAGRAAFWSIPFAGGIPRLLVRFTDPERQSVRHEFAVNGRRFYFPVEDRESDVFIADLSRPR